MTYIVVPRPFLSAPYGRYRVNFEHPLAQEARLSWVWTAANPRHVFRSTQRYGGDALISTDTGVPTATDLGLGMSYAAASSQHTDMGFSEGLQYGSFGVVFRSAAVNCFALSCSSSASTSGVDFLIGSGGVSGTNVFRYRDTSTKSSNATSGHNDGRFHHYTGRLSAGDSVHGVIIGASLVADASTVIGGNQSPVSSFTPSQNWMIARRGTLYADTEVVSCYMGEIPLSDSAALEFQANFWDLFERDPYRIYSFPATGIPTLSAPGVIDITATSARPQVTLTY